MPHRTSNPHIRNQLRLGEELIRQRSLAAEGRWSCDKWQQTSAGATTTRVLAVLDTLDRHSFDRVDATNSLETLYAKIFAPTPTSAGTNKDSPNATDATKEDNVKESRTDYNVSEDEAVVGILCEWAVSGLRYGEHRAMAVAKLLEKRQQEILNITNHSNETDQGDDKDSTASLPAGLPIFQPLLMKFLDNDAPVLGMAL